MYFIVRSPSRAKTHIDQRKLAAKKKELRSLIKFYKKRIQWLSVDSRLHFGLVAGNRVAVIAESSKNMVELNNGEVFREFQTALKPLIEDQLANKEIVYFISFANSPSPRNPQGLPFTKFQAQYVVVLIKSQSILVCMSVHLPVYLSVCLSIFPSSYVVCMSVFPSS